MASILMLDTDIVSYLVKERRPSIRPRFVEHDPAILCVSAVTKSELLYGLRLLEPTHDLHLKVRRFLGDIAVAAWDGDAAEIHASLRHQLISTGRTIGEMDMMIAAHAIALGATLVTNNTRHFARLAPSLTIETWVADMPD